jgi:flagellar hook assembly protein FlgD
MLATALPFASPARAADPAPLKAVFIVGPTNSLTDMNLRDAEQMAVEAEAWGMDVRRVFWPNATWENVLANIQGANLVYYAGHGYGWPSPYTSKMTESRQNGMGLNTFAGSSKSNYTYYGASLIKQYITLAPNAIVFLNHLCYSAGNAEEGMAIPTWDVARQRVDNMANGWLAVGAKAVFAYPQQLFVRALRQLQGTPTMTVEDIFKTVGTKPTPYYGYIGWDPRKFDSVRTPGTKNFLDPHQTQGFYRAISGNLSLTGTQWKAGVDGPGAPTMNDLSVPGGTTGASLVGSNQPLITPNGDGVSDSLTMTYRVNKEAFVDFTVRNGSGDVVRNFTSWSPEGNATAVWNGRNNAGNFVSDGEYTLTGRPRNRAGEEGGTESVSVRVLTTMRAPTVLPAHFYAADGDAVAATTTFSVNITRPAALSWKVVDSNGDTMRTFMADQNVGTGLQTWVWDGRNDGGAYVPDGMYYTVMTAATSAGTYSHKLPVDVRAFRASPVATPPFLRGTKSKFFVFSAEPLAAKPKIKVTLPGLAPKTYSTYAKNGGWYAAIVYPTTAQAGTATYTVFGFDKVTGLRQESTFTFQVK